MVAVVIMAARVAVIMAAAVVIMMVPGVMLMDMNVVVAMVMVMVMDMDMAIAGSGKQEVKCRMKEDPAIFGLIIEFRSKITKVSPAVIAKLTFLLACYFLFLTSILLSHRNIFIQVYILGSIQQRYAFLKRPLKCFAAKDQSHTTGSFVDNSRIY